MLSYVINTTAAGYTSADSVSISYYHYLYHFCIITIAMGVFRKLLMGEQEVLFAEFEIVVEDAEKTAKSFNALIYFIF